MNAIPKISFVSPVYQAEDTLHELVSEIKNIMNVVNETYEIILVDDRSSDNSWEVMKSLSQNNSNIKAIRLSKNFGQHPAIIAGLTDAKGEWIVVLDCDLQDKPKEIAKLYSKTREGFDIVLAKRKNRDDSILKKMSSKLFSIIFSYFTDTKYNNEVANFGIYRNKVIKSVLEVSDQIKFFPLFVDFVGYNSTSIFVDHSKRKSGKSNYTYKKLINLAFNAIISYSNKPLKIFVKLGLFISLISFCFGMYNVILYFNGQIEVLGYASIITSIWLLSGILITIIGVTGIYIGKIFDQVKKRPVFIIDEIV